MSAPKEYGIPEESLLGFRIHTGPNLVLWKVNIEKRRSLNEIIIFVNKNVSISLRNISKIVIYLKANI